MARPEEAARQLLLEQNISRAPVPVERLARALGARLSYEPSEDDDVSGMLFRDGTRTIIGVNAGHPSNRQRFTIAHEIGHLLLHPGRPIILDKLVRVNRRDSISALASDRQEIQANQFAASLLMPRELVASEMKRLLTKQASIAENQLIHDLAAAFSVSSEAMGHRLTNLGVLRSQ